MDISNEREDARRAAESEYGDAPFGRLLSLFVCPTVYLALFTSQIGDNPIYAIYYLQDQSQQLDCTCALKETRKVLRAFVLLVPLIPQRFNLQFCTSSADLGADHDSKNSNPRGLFC